MELKLIYRYAFCGCIRLLLIVPYGIETLYLHAFADSESKLLIVPYGIETVIVINT